MKKEISKNKIKKAVSPLIATVILIAIVVSASSTVYIWSRGFIAEQLEKFGSPAEVICEGIDFAAQLETAGGTSYELLVNNRANVDIHKLNLNFNKQGKSIIKTFSADDGSVKKGSTGKVSFDLGTIGVSSFESIDVTPVLLASGKSSKTSKLFTCKSRTIEGIKA